MNCISPEPWTRCVFAFFFARFLSFLQVSWRFAGSFFTDSSKLESNLKVKEKDKEKVKGICRSIFFVFFFRLFGMFLLYNWEKSQSANLWNLNELEWNRIGFLSFIVFYHFQVGFTVFYQLSVLNIHWNDQMEQGTLFMNVSFAY